MSLDLTLVRTITITKGNVTRSQTKQPSQQVMPESIENVTSLVNLI